MALNALHLSNFNWYPYPCFRFCKGISFMIIMWTSTSLLSFGTLFLWWAYYACMRWALSQTHGTSCFKFFTALIVLVCLLGLRHTISNAFSTTSNISLDIWYKDDDNMYKTASHKDNVIVTVIVLGKSKHVLLHSLFMDYFFIEYFAIHLNWTQLNWECR